jgi:hypothetical protein
MERVCKQCLLREMAGADAAMIETYKAKIRQEDRVNEKIYEARLLICKGCEKLNAGTCSACGCYVELRALSPMAGCPYKKWKAV